jgi:autotransporter-associated beta strand protein
LFHDLILSNYEVSGNPGAIHCCPRGMMSANLRSKWCLPKLVAGILLSLIIANPALAATYTWTSGGGTLEWGDVNNWNPVAPAGGPGSGDDIIIDNQYAIELTQSESVNSIIITNDNSYLAVIGAAGQNYTVTTNNVTANGADNMLIPTVAGTGIIITSQLSFGANNFWLTGTGYIQVQGTNSIVGTGAVSIGDHLRLELSGNQTFNYVEDPGGTADTIIALSNSCTLGLNIGSGTEYYEGVIQGTGNLRKLGTGNLVLYGLNTYTGSTTVSAGVLGAVDSGAATDNQLPDTTDLIISSGATCVVDYQDLASLSGSGNLHILIGESVYIWGPGNHTFNGTITEDIPSALLMDAPGIFTINGTVATDLEIGRGTVVLNGTVVYDIYGWDGVLKGTGTCTGGLGFIFGTFMPGNSIGTFTVGAGGALGFLDPNAGLVIEVNGDTADQVVVNGPVDLFDGALSVNGVPTKGTQFTIINITSADTVTGNFTGLPEGTIFTSGGSQYQITYVGGDGNDVVITALDIGPDPPPEPRPAPDITQGTSPNPTTSLGGPQLNWPHVGGSNFYRVYRADCPTCDRKQVGRVQGNSFIDASALPGQPYYYWIRTENPGGLSDYSDWMVAWRYEQNPGRAGDFNGDGIMDLLWWDPDTGRLTVWLMNGGEVQSAVTYGQGLDVSQWLLINTGDFNGNGIWDLLWWNPATGEVMAGLEPFSPRPQPRSSTQEASASIIGNISGNAEISYTGDLNGDGITDILWRDYASGQVTLWIMGADGMPQLDGPPTPADPGIIEGGRPGVSGALDWQVGGLGDANGNGRADVFWKQASNNRLVTWFMEGSTITGLAQEDKGLDTNWRLSGLGDLNGDRLADIVWRRTYDGALQAWLMRSGIFSQERSIMAGSSQVSDWQVKAVGDFCNPDCDDVYCKNMESGAAKIVTLDGQEFNPAVE